LLIVVVILIPLAIAVAVTLWSLEQARQRNRKNRPGAVRRVAVPAAAPAAGTASATSRPLSGRDERQPHGGGNWDGDDRADADRGADGGIPAALSDSGAGSNSDLDGSSNG
jgi:hypothetical protein